MKNLGCAEQDGFDDDEEALSATVAAGKQRAGWTDAVRSQALTLYAEVGPTAAAKAFGPDGPDRSTICRWAKSEGLESFRNERTAAATDAMTEQWKLRRAALANDFGEASVEALAASRQAIRIGKANDARQYMITSAVSVDKADVLSGVAAQPAAAIPTSMAEAHAALAHLLSAAGVIDVMSTEVAPLPIEEQL